MNYDLRQYSKNIYSKGMMTYLMENYIDKYFWMERLKACFDDCSVINITDFNYSKCFTTFVNFTALGVDLGTDAYRRYLNSNVIYGLRIEISALGPFAVFWFIKHFIRDGKEEYVQEESPFLNEHNKFDERTKSFLKNNNLIRLNKEEISLRVPDLSLELAQENTSVYNCLFFDSSN